METSIHRDLGRVEAKVENLSTDVVEMKKDVAFVKEYVQALKNQKQWKAEQLAAVGVLSGMIVQLFNFVKPLL